MKSYPCRSGGLQLILLILVLTITATSVTGSGAVVSPGTGPPSTLTAADAAAASSNAAIASGTIKAAGAAAGGGGGLLSTTTNTNVDWFASLDTNRDGSVDRTEFQQGLLKLETALQLPNAPLTSASTSTKTSSSFPFFSFFTLSSPDTTSTTTTTTTTKKQKHGSFWKGFTSGVAMILATEIGDKTFFIAAVLSMRHARSAVFCGAILALIIMTILSSAMGFILPQFMDRKYTHLLGGALFLYFGVKLVYESKQMEANRVSEELEEVEEELLHRKKDDKENPDIDEEKGSKTSLKQQQLQQPPLSSSSAIPFKNMSNNNNKKPKWFQICLQSLTLTFLAEWGDRSQIATIALAAAKNPYGVTVGGCLGHSICTGLAVLGGRMLAARISEKTVSFWGGMVFLVFGLHSIFMER